MSRLGAFRAPSGLASITYRSRAAYALSDPELLNLLRRCREWNRLLEVTGVLVFDRLCFFQCVEGSESSLTKVMKRIRQDPRHVDIQIVAHHRIPRRLYPGWDMQVARRVGQPTLEADCLVVTDARHLDELHVDAMGVRSGLSSLSVEAWRMHGAR